ncbi:MAG: hypothetical protein GF311_25780 [Candidatus Lokiarchaeota archaeon]|nr:hypothetical protein [Candidatus Lokiarchaeota archaeon]
MSNKNHSLGVLVTNEKILDLIAHDWMERTEIKKKLKIRNQLDNRLLKIKLKILERKDLIESKYAKGNTYYKKVESLCEGIEKSQSRVISDETKVDYTHFNSKEHSDHPEIKPNYQKVKTKEGSFSVGSHILKINKSLKRIEYHKDQLRKDPNNAHFKDLLNKAQNQLNKLKAELADHSYFICLYCKRVLRSKRKLDDHIYFKHHIRLIECVYCNQKFSSESDYSAHRKTHQLDLHGHYLKDAIEEVIVHLGQCKEYETKGLILIHGYHHGQTLKNYFRSNSFIREMKNAGFKISIEENSRPGSTGILLRG